MSIDIKIHTYMEPCEVGDGHGFRSIVSPEPDIYLLVSEVHHGAGPYRVDETLVFPCDQSGEVLSFTELHGGRAMNTAEAILDIERYWSRSSYNAVVRRST